jgi:tetratricopeptide (TPR) repeat protein
MENNNTTSSIKRRISTLKQHVLSRPFMWTNKAASSITNEERKQNTHAENLTAENTPIAPPAPTQSSANQPKDTPRTTQHNTDELTQTKSKQPESKPTPPTINVSDIESGKISTDQLFDQAMDLIDSTQYDHARQIIFTALPYCDNDDSVRRAYRIIGLSYYKPFDFNNALPWFRKAAHDSTNAQDLFNFASTAAQIPGQDKLSQFAFEQLETLHRSKSFQLKPSFWNHLYWFVIALVNGQKYTQAFTLLGRLKLAYKRARFTDVEYLTEIGLPPFEDFISLCITLFKRVDRMEQLVEFFNQMKEHVDEAGRVCNITFLIFYRKLLVQY